MSPTSKSLGQPGTPQPTPPPDKGPTGGAYGNLPNPPPPAPPSPALPPAPAIPQGSPPPLDFPTNFGTGGSGNVPGGWKIYKIGGKYYLVYMAPVGDGEFVPIAYEADALDLTSQFGWTMLELEENVEEVLSVGQFEAAGGLVVGLFEELDLTTGLWEDPFEHWLDELTEQAILAPWLLDPEVMAIAAAAFLEGRSMTQAELVGTEWWQTHNAAEREWLLLASADPAEAETILESRETMIVDMLHEAGISNAADIMVTDENGNEMSLAAWLTRAFVTGTWTEVKLETQIRLLADPLLDGPRDEALMAALGGREDFIDITQSDEDTVRALYLKWLGPLYGNVPDSVIEKWASQLRNDPDARIRLEEFLAGQRVALFPAYDDRTLTYEDISGPWKNLFFSIWGEIPDETDPFFTNIVNLNDGFEAAKRLRMEGLNRGIGQVITDAVSDLNRAFGGGVVRAL